MIPLLAQRSLQKSNFYVAALILSSKLLMEQIYYVRSSNYPEQKNCLNKYKFYWSTKL